MVVVVVGHHMVVGGTEVGTAHMEVVGVTAEADMVGTVEGAGTWTA
jgi:hypothetical protein